jgi:hypothetical protein
MSRLKAVAQPIPWPPLTSRQKSRLGRSIPHAHCGYGYMTTAAFETTAVFPQKVETTWATGEL